MNVKNTSANMVVIFLILLFSFGVINILFTPQSQIISYPVNHDDYSALSSVFSGLSWHTTRPVSSFFIALFAKFGYVGYFFWMYGLTILYSTLVFCFVLRFFSISLSIEWIILYAALIFSPAIIIDFTKYLGLTTNLTSILLGVISMFSLLKAYRESKNIFFVFSVFFFTLSLFAKEDFILPNFLLIAYLFFFEKEEMSSKTKTKKIKLLFLFSFFMTAIIALILFNKYIVHSGFTGMGVSSVSYQINVSFPSILHVLLHYLTFDHYARILSYGVLLTFILSLFFKNFPITVKILFLLLITISLIMPYTVLPNHIFSYYSYNWLPWQVSSIVVGLFFLASAFPRKIICLCIFIIALLAVMKTQAERNSRSAWYRQGAVINKNMADTLLHYKKILNQENIIGIVGLTALSPWSLNSGEYLYNILGITPKWIVFVDKSNVFYVINPNDNLDRNQRINVLSFQKICDFKNLKYIYFNADGKGKLIDDCRLIPITGTK